MILFFLLVLINTVDVVDKISAQPHTFVMHTSFDYTYMIKIRFLHIPIHSLYIQVSTIIIHTCMNSLCELVCIYYVHVVVCMEHTYYPHWPHKPQTALFRAKHYKVTVILHSFHGRSRPKEAYYVWSWAEILRHAVVFFSTTLMPTK